MRVARSFNTYGPRMLPNDERVVSNFVVQCLRGEPITLSGDGQQTRSFCYVNDLEGDRGFADGRRVGISIVVTVFDENSHMDRCS